MASAAEDRKYMGTAADAQTALLAKLREWRELRQPMMATGKELKVRDRRENQLRFEICNAGLHWLWHVENPSD
jgi:hypothetical protein